MWRNPVLCSPPQQPTWWPSSVASMAPQHVMPTTGTVLSRRLRWRSAPAGAGCRSSSTEKWLVARDARSSARAAYSQPLPPAPPLTPLCRRQLGLDDPPLPGRAGLLEHLAQLRRGGGGGAALAGVQRLGQQAAADAAQGAHAQKVGAARVQQACRAERDCAALTCAKRSSPSNSSTPPRRCCR